MTAGHGKLQAYRQWDWVRFEIIIIRLTIGVTRKGFRSMWVSVINVISMGSKQQAKLVK